MPAEYIAALMFGTMLMLMLTGQRMFGIIGFVAVVAAILLWGDRGGHDLAFSQSFKLMNWFPLITLPMFIFMGYVLSESRLADDLYRMFHVWFGPVPGGLAIGTILLMVLISAMNGLSVAGMAIGATIALPELLKRSYDKRMVTGVIQAGASLGILIPPSVVMVLYAMIARQPVTQLWMAGILPGLMMASLFISYIWIRCRLNPALGPAISDEERAEVLGPPRVRIIKDADGIIIEEIEDSSFNREKSRLLLAGLLPLAIFAVMMVPFIMGYTRLVESSVIGALAAFSASVLKGRMTWAVLETCTRMTLAISCMFLWIILAALAFGAVFDGLRAVDFVRALFVEELGLNRWQILILMQLSFLIMGAFLDDTAMLVIVAPLYVPIVRMLEFDLIWYGVLYTITCQIAYMTPPFGYNLFLMRAMAPPEVTLADIYRSIFPFVGVMILGLALVMAFPQIALWLPQTLGVR
ncbi:TRAP transporter large permease subunit [Pararhodobacter sp. SW119]|uniref:TRAP transporter large permease n=1 Tax=Pararhodobacter sp. SW119 TaxID=2780075 RepID=UPI001AE08F15|nr:TRAP transporter large permease subunit [Pararhodobacter sp. SW119]